MRRYVSFLVITVLIIACGMAKADPIHFSGSDAGNSFDGTASYSGGALTISLTNNASSVADLTGFAFNSAIADVTVSEGTVNLTSVDYGTSFGVYQFGVSGVALTPGHSTTLSFAVAGDGAPSVSSALSFFTNGGTIATDEPLVAQFGNVYVGDVVGVDPNAPLPATVWGGLTLLGAFGVRQRVNSRRRTIA